MKDHGKFINRFKGKNGAHFKEQFLNQRKAIAKIQNQSSGVMF